MAGRGGRVHPDLVVLDLQIGNMGGIATCIDLRHEAGAGRLPDVPVLMLLDRQADVFLARRSGADGWVVKPLDAFSLRRAATAILEGEGDTTVERELVGDVNPGVEPTPPSDGRAGMPSSTSTSPLTGGGSAW